jgi:hypothetical protein
MTGAGHKSGHAANVAEAHRKAELAREQEELLSSRKGKGRGEDELDAREVKLLDELRRSLTPQALLGKGVGALASTSGKSYDNARAKGIIITTAIPNRKSMLKSAEVVHAEKEKKEKKKKKKKRDREEEDEDEEERKEAKETTKTKTKTYLSKAERKRLKKKKQQQL